MDNQERDEREAVKRETVKREMKAEEAPKEEAAKEAAALNFALLPMWKQDQLKRERGILWSRHTPRLSFLLPPPLSPMAVRCVVEAVMLGFLLCSYETDLAFFCGTLERQLCSFY